MLYSNIKVLRTLKKVSQKSMAEFLHKSQSAYCRMEKGEIRISHEDLAKISSILDCKTEDLLSENGVADLLYKTVKDKSCEMNFSSEAFKSDALQSLIANQNKLVNELRTFLSMQSEQIKLIREVMLSLKK